MNKAKVITTAVLATVLVASQSLPLKAEGNDSSDVTKDESVYTVLNADGSIKEITVSDSLHSNSGFKDYKDTSVLTDVENLKSTDPVSSTNGGYIWNSEATDIYYQGTSTKELPLSVKIIYTLNNKEYSPEDIVGKSGHVTIKISVTNSSKQIYTVNNKNYELVTPFVTGLGAMLDDDNFTNVTVNHGTVDSDSSHSIVAGVMIPGLKAGLKQVLDYDTMNKLEDYLFDDITIEADTTSFESPTLMIAAATSTDDLKEDFTDTDFTSIFDQLDELKDATNKLIDGSKSLYDGAITLNDGVATLQDGANKLNDGASTLSDGADSLYSGANTLYEGLGKVSSNSSSINDGVQAVADAILKTVNASLTEQGFEAITWSNYADKLKAYIGNVTDAEIANAKKQIMDLAGVDESTANVLIYMAAINTATDKSFNEKVAIAGATLKEAQAIQTSDAFVEANKIVAAIATTDPAFDFDNKEESTNKNAKVTQVLTAIRTQIAASPSKDDLDTAYSTICGQIKTAVKTIAQTDIDDTKAGVILAYACEKPISTDVLGTDNIRNAAGKVLAGEVPTGAADPRNDEAVVTVLKAAYASTVNATSLAVVYQQVIQTINQGDNSALVFAYGVTKHESYDVTKDTPTSFFTDYSDDLTKLASAQANIEAAASEEGQQLIKGVLTQIVAQTLDSNLTPVLSQLNDVNKLVQGVKAYTAGVDQCYSGSKSLKDGSSKLADGAKTLKDGTSSLTSGVNTLKDGSSKLADGAKTLYDGLVEYNDEGISKLTDDSRISSLEDASNLLNAVKEQGSAYNNYSGISEGTDGSVKFVFKVEGVKNTATSTTTEETTKTKTSFWDRIVNLFDFLSLFSK